MRYSRMIWKNWIIFISYTRKIMDYTLLPQQDQEIVEKRLRRKSITTFVPYTNYKDMCEMYLTDDKKDHYVIRTRWHQTASKVKCFMKSPEEYHIRYNLELPELTEKDNRHFVIWKAFDDLLSYWMEKFNENFYIDDWLVVDELKQKLIERWENPVEVKAMKLPELRAIYYRDWDRIRLTPAEWKDVIWMYYEAMRQPQFELNMEYEPQKYFECKYRDKLIISWTLDRHRPGVIRDRKTSWNIDNFERDIENTFDYVTQMSFYYVLAYISTGEECDVYLDIMSKKAPYTSIVYKLSAEKLKRKMQNDLKPALDAMITCFEKNIRPASDRYVAMKSPYYPIMQGSMIIEPVESN